MEELFVWRTTKCTAHFLEMLPQNQARPQKEGKETEICKQLPHSVLEGLISSITEYVLAIGSAACLFTCQAGESFKSFVHNLLSAKKGFLGARKEQKYNRLLIGKEWRSQEYEC